LLADLPHEYRLAPDSLRQRLLLLRGTAAFWRTLFVCGTVASWRAIMSRSARGILASRNAMEDVAVSRISASAGPSALAAALTPGHADSTPWIRFDGLRRHRRSAGENSAEPFGLAGTPACDWIAIRRRNLVSFEVFERAASHERELVRNSAKPPVLARRGPAAHQRIAPENACRVGRSDRDLLLQAGAGKRDDRLPFAL
jgi:hypothetical protein